MVGGKVKLALKALFDNFLPGLCGLETMKNVPKESWEDYVVVCSLFESIPPFLFQ